MVKRNLETCFSPALFRPEENHNSIVVVIDVLRASSAICTAFSAGANKIIPVAGIEEAREYKKKGFLVAAERDGYTLDFADFGNSPFNFTPERVRGRTIVYSTTNGTGIIKLSSSSYMVIIGTFLNLGYVVQFLEKQDRNVLLFCAGWKNRFNLEDTVCAGAISEKLISTSKYSTICDSTSAAMDLWSQAKNDLPGYIEKAAQRSRLRDKGLDDCLEYCLTIDGISKIPVVKDGYLVCED